MSCCNSIRFNLQYDQSVGVHNLCPAAQIAVIVKVLNLDRHICDKLDRVTAAIQQAQLRHLSPTLLNSSQIKTLMYVVRQ